jgi:predicted phage terminase large subunit-like protein
MNEALLIDTRNNDPYAHDNFDKAQRRINIMRELLINRARNKHLNFIDFMWNNPSEPFTIGHHTRVICEQIDDAIEKLRNRKSVFKVIMTPFRHGKSEIVSRKLPAHFLGLFPYGKVLLTGHTASLSVGYSRESRNLLDTERYQLLYPETKLDRWNMGAAHWKVKGTTGEVFSCGLGGSMAGQGYTLGIVDDYCRNRADAESPTVRNRMWHSFTNDFLTRRAPVSITIVTATPWHPDDIIGRIKKEMADNPTFPKFEFISMPAFSEDYKDGVLFPERFNRDWYETQRSALGTYGTASLLQLDPVMRGGNMIKTDNVKKIPLESFPDILYYRVWDLAHTKKERESEDPDYTSGTLLGFRRKPGAVRQWQLYVKDVERFRLDAPQRDIRILNTTERDGPGVKVGIENSIDSKDAFRTLQETLLGKRTVYPVKTKGDKVVRASPLEPLFESGDVFIPEGAPWESYWLEELASFPSGKHDDQVDNLSAGYALCTKPTGAISVEMTGY